MAEPITAAGLAASVVQLIGATVKAYKYLNDVKNAPKERAKLSLEAANLVPLLDSLRDQVENAPPNDPWIESVLALGGSNGPVELFKRTMDQLKRKLKMESPMLRMGKHLVWTLTKEDIHKLLADIERFKIHLMLALQKDNLKLSRAIKADTAGIEPLGERVQNVSENVDTLNASIRAQAKTRVEGTGQWFLDSPELVCWRDGTEETLFCPGIPGAGKTVIASLVIDHLRERIVNEKSTFLLYVYCFYKDRSQQTPANIIAGLLKQLIQCQENVPEQIKELYESSLKRNSRPTQNELSSVLRSVLSQFGKVFIVVDALDEYSENLAAPDSLLAELQSLQTFSNMMLTSRFTCPFTDAFQELNHLTISADDHDIRRYLTSQLPTLPQCVRTKPDLQELTVQTITEAVEGMFLLARLHMRSLVDKVDARKVREALRRLPKGSGSAASNSAYDEAFERIKAQEQGFRDLAFSTMSWTSLAYRPLTVKELQYALSIEPGDTAIDEENCIDEDTLISVCAGLVVIDRGNDIVRLAHYTMQEYFDRRKNDLFKDADTIIAITCITYLLFDEFSNVPKNDLLEIREDPRRRTAHFKAHPLLDYAANHWGYHVGYGVGAAMKGLCLEFLRHDSKLAASLATMHNKFRDFPGNDTEFFGDFYGLWIAARFDLADMIAEILDADGVLTRVSLRRSMKALCVAITHGNYRTVDLLIKKTDGIVVTAIGSPALLCAAWSGNKRCVITVLEAGANINAVLNNLTALVYAVELDGTTLIKISEILLRAGADVNKCSPLLYAVSRSNDALVELLLQNGVDPNGVFSHRAFLNDASPLNTAVIMDQIAIVDLPLRHGAQICPAGHHNSYDNTALHFAASESMVRLLIERGANANTVNTSGNTPLHTAAAHTVQSSLTPSHLISMPYFSSFEVVALLIRNSASVTQVGYRGLTPLHYATWSSDLEVARLLLMSGADVDAKDDSGFPALAYAHDREWNVRPGDTEPTFGGEKQMTELLAEFDADPRAFLNDILARELSDLPHEYPRYSHIDLLTQDRRCKLVKLLKASISEDGY